ncbi:anaphase-promoting complex subunit 4-like [Eucalyptus grandis]|uniref:anaphase-promoting complex subunit 4-like n=1 Tax=Eucalyptus grandis TaxID=71139 RepID=UPI00192E91FE|nr:anaphase-promoting complex subunit 4-like [Eucalyptus grandis]
MASFNLKVDRTTQFFPPALGVPQMPGLVPGDAGLTDKVQDSFVELSNSSKQCLHSLCNGDIDVVLHFSIFGVFPIEYIVNVLSVQIKYLAIRYVIFSK